MQRLLIAIPFGIGDVLFTTPMISALKQHYPGIEISYLTSGRSASFLKNDPRISKVFSYDRDEFVAVYRRSPWQFLLKWKAFIHELKSEKFDIVFDLSLNSGLGLALKMAGIPRRIGHNYKGRGRFLTDALSLSGYVGRHVVEHHFDLWKFLGITAKPGRMEFSVLPEDDQWAERFVKENGLEQAFLVGQFPGGGASWGQGGAVRRWSTEKHAKLAEKIVEKGLGSIILMGDKHDVALCTAVSGQMSCQSLIAAGRATLGQSAALMKRCRFLLMNDGGAMHIAAALQVPTVVIFGPVDERIYGPFPVDQQHIAALDIACRPCYRNFRMSDCQHLSCLKDLAVDDVFKVIERMLG